MKNYPIVYGIFLGAIGYISLLAYLLPYYHSFIINSMAWSVGMLLLKPLYKSHSYWIESSVLLLTYYCFPCTETQHIPVYCNLMVTILLFASYPIVHLKARLFANFIMLFLLGCSVIQILPFSFDWESLLILLATFFSVAIFTSENFRHSQSFPESWDMIVASHSGNTAHYVAEFLRNIPEELRVRFHLHRFFNHEKFFPSLNCQGLIVAFSVSGWKPCWTLCSYILFRLPRGQGKPCYIFYTSSCGPENAGLSAWLLLTCKGYRVIGRNWSPYPLNVVTFRLGTKKFWKNTDESQPYSSNLTEIHHIAQNWFTSNTIARFGLPNILWPFPLLILGILLDNKYFNWIFYRNYVWKRRCIQCGLCTKVCPVQRLSLGKHGYPIANGTCSLCLMCINLCPTNAMHIVGASEYGQVYWPRWPEYIMKQDKECIIHGNTQ